MMNEVVVAGIRLPNPPSSVMSWQFVAAITPPMLMDSRAFETAWENNNSNANTGICKAIAMKTKPKCAVVEYDMVRLISTCASATKEPPIALMLPITNNTVSATGEC